MLRLAIVGLGHAGRTHLASSRSAKGIAVAAGCDPSAVARQAVLREGIPTFRDLADLLDRVEVDAAAICTPPAAHAQLAAPCLDRGLHVLCEKPLVTSLAAALHLARHASVSKRHLVVASKFRHVPEVQRVRDMLHGGEIGEPLGFEVSFCAAIDMAARWNARRRVSGGGVIIDNGCHAFDIIEFLFGPIGMVSATAWRPVQRLEVEDGATVQVRAGNGVVGTVHLSWSWVSGHDTYLTVRGTRGAIEVGWSGARVQRGDGTWRRFGRAYDKLAAHRAMYTWFAEVVAGRRPPWISVVECLRVFGAVHAAHRSLWSNGWETVAIAEDARRRVAV